MEDSLSDEFSADESKNYINIIVFDIKFRHSEKATKNQLNSERAEQFFETRMVF